MATLPVRPRGAPTAARPRLAEYERGSRPGCPGQHQPGESARAGPGWAPASSATARSGGAPGRGAVPAARRARVGRSRADCGGHVAASAAATASASWAAAAVACARRTGLPPSARALPLPPPGPRAATWARGERRARRRAPQARTPLAAGRGARGSGPAAASALPRRLPRPAGRAVAPAGLEEARSQPPPHPPTPTSSFGNPVAAPHPQRE